jgi:predicted nucleotide-binding protein
MSGSDPKFDYVFISHSHKDEVWARDTLFKLLEDNKLKVCIDYRDFAVGEPSVKGMERAITTSRKTILVLAPA